MVDASPPTVDAGLRPIDANLPLAEDPDETALTRRFVVPILAPDDTPTPPPMLPTRFGPVSLGHHWRDRKQEGAPVLRFDSKTVFEVDMESLELDQVMAWGERDVVLFSTNGMGSGCVSDGYHVLVLSPNSPPRVLSCERCWAESGAGKLVIEGGQLRLDLGYEDKQHKYAIIRPAKLELRRELVHNVPLEEGTCRWLYNDVLDAMARHNECDLANTWVSGSINRGVALARDQPGLRDEALDRIANEVCRHLPKPVYAAFAQEVCSRP